MLQELSIKNFAIIDDLQIRFSDGFTILSGETGAGKSIIINAVNLLLGSRATADFIRTGAETAELEALFGIEPESRAARILSENDLNPSEGLLIRRIIVRNGRHRIYINNRLSTSALLNAVTENLASISGQHAHQRLLDDEQHLLMLDQYGGLMPLREKVRDHFQEIQPLIRELDGLCALRDRQAEQRALLEFQRDEIRAADIRPGEDAELEQELVLLKNGEKLYEAVHGGIEELYSAQNAIVERLTEVKKQLEKACQLDPSLTPKAEQIADTTFRIEDIAEDLRDYLSHIRIDEKQLEATDERLNTLRKLRRKYGGSLEAVSVHLEAVETELASVENLSDRIAAAEQELAGKHGALSEIVRRLSEKRAGAGADLARKVEKELASLRMSNTRFGVALSPVPASAATPSWLRLGDGAVTETGADRATFIIAPNVGEALKPLTAIASGGELSRVVLALRAILVKTDAVGTVIFDEVDAGIGGSVAEIVGQKIASLGRYHQVICITHLAQIARFGDHHFRISKQVSAGRTRTTIRPLKQEDRVREIARMLGGVKMTQATLDHALEMFRER
ncbi:DNA repair protein RecN [Desulfonema ishimotonii]|uniref:DNA repair protein RecN n=1 Tax=Desulfonema ishimotonii TaxID=45657 RepID=A0A401G0S6_9BACT|nr:DNA repair protein RecN [Desulfonema ishimotonii]GBC62796.1 DNA repair protein RecN [Desulfonema ishimotonii]